MLGIPPDGTPVAEVWYGAHPASPSTVERPDASADGLDAVLAADAACLLGGPVVGTFGTRLPYLAKILAVAEPLSLQVHPDAARAAAGYAAEDAAGVDRDAPDRGYRDPHHKPEMVIALEPFDALCGWRDLAATRRLLGGLDVVHPSWAALHDRLAHLDDAEALRGTVTWLLDAGAGTGLVEAVVAAVATAAPPTRTAADPGGLDVAVELAARHPGDPGVVVALLLNRVRLERGEALHLPPGAPHTYLRGTALEVMAASDNVLRAGLTRKHVDPAAVLDAVGWSPLPMPLVRPDLAGPWRLYDPGEAEFRVWWADLDDTTPVVCPAEGPRIVIGLDPVELENSGTRVGLDRGGAVFVPATDGPVTVAGPGTVAVVDVPPR